MAVFDLGPLGSADVGDFLYVTLTIPWEEFARKFQNQQVMLSPRCLTLLHVAVTSKQVYTPGVCQSQLIQFFKAVQAEATVQAKRAQDEQRQDYVQKIRETIIQLGSKYPRLLVSEIAEECNVSDPELIVSVITDMIAKGQIHAKYFKSSEAVAFDQQANLQAVQDLEAAFKTWGKDAAKKE